MPEFRVVTDALTGAASILDSPGCPRSALWAGAAADTPVAGAWWSLAERSERASMSADRCAEDLRRALQLAGDAYRIADESAAASLDGRS